MFKRIFKLTPISIILWSTISMADGNSALVKLSKKYSATKLVEMNVEKIVVSDLLGKETKHIGKIYISGGKFRWENTKPEKTLLVFDGKNIWSEQTPPPEFGGPVQVAKGVVDKKNRSHLMVTSLLSGDLVKNFKVIKEIKNGNKLNLEIVPKTPDLTIKNINVSVDTKENILQNISYKDDIGNLTKLDLSNIKFLSTAKNKLFKYQPPKNAQVTDL